MCMMQMPALCDCFTCLGLLHILSSEMRLKPTYLGNGFVYVAELINIVISFWITAICVVIERGRV